MVKSFLNLIEERLDTVDKVFHHVNKGLDILQRADDLAGELSTPDFEPCMQGEESEDQEE